MSEKLRAAAEEIAFGDYGAFDLPPREEKLWKAAEELAKAWLTEHPADDDPAYLGRKVPPPLTAERVAKAVEGLFLNGVNQRASRLVLVDDSRLPASAAYAGWNLGGMCSEAVVAHLCREFGVEGGT